MNCDRVREGRNRIGARSVGLRDRIEEIFSWGIFFPDYDLASFLSFGERQGYFEEEFYLDIKGK